jgi:hypothetical protein
LGGMVRKPLFPWAMVTVMTGADTGCIRLITI